MRLEGRGPAAASTAQKSRYCRERITQWPSEDLSTLDCVCLHDWGVADGPSRQPPSFRQPRATAQERDHVQSSVSDRTRRTLAASENNLVNLSASVSRLVEW